MLRRKRNKKETNKQIKRKGREKSEESEPPFFYVIKFVLNIKKCYN